MKRIIRSALAAPLLLAAVSAYATGCEYDTQCKGDRICEKGICVYPPQGANFPSGRVETLPLPPPPPPAREAPQKKGGFSLFGKSDDDRAADTPNDGLPHFCCTSFGRYGPYEGSTGHEGDRCYATDNQGIRRSGAPCK